MGGIMMLKICVAGKNDIAVNILEYLYNNCKQRYSLCVICNKNETGVDGWQRSLRSYAKRLGVEECNLAEVYNNTELIFLSLEFDSIVKPELFNTSRLYNIHFSLLPAYKGMYTSAMPILNNEKYVGVTFHYINSGIDTGDIISQIKFPLDKDDTARDLYKNYIKYGTELILENIEKVILNDITAKKQSVVGSSYFSKKHIDYSNLVIDLNQTAEMIHNQIKAFSFREYQLPCVNGHNIIAAKITSIRSLHKAGGIIFETEHEMMLSTIDYNIILFFDRLDELLTACQHGNLQKVIEICAIKEHINAVGKNGWTPLIVATYNNQIDIVKKLILMGADIYAKNFNGTNLLMYAKDAFYNTGDMELFKLFIQLGLSVMECDYNRKNLINYIQYNEYDPRIMELNMFIDNVRNSTGNVR
jgi:methionyl-tRNA formyltransferase